MPCSVREFFTHGTFDEDSPTACDKMILKTVEHANWSQISISLHVSILPFVTEEFHHVVIINFEQLSYYQKYPLNFQFCQIYSYSY